MLRLLVLIFSFSMTATAVAQSIINQQFVDSLAMNQRVGLHGMVVYGSGKYFMSHIPMMNMPHDIQLVIEVELLNQSGQKIQSDFSQATTTIRPSTVFSLNNLAKFQEGQSLTFTASVHNGSFELGAPVIVGLESVIVVVKKLKVVRPLPSSSSVESIEFVDGENKFNVNLITDERNIQQVINVNGNKSLWCVLGPDFFTPCPQN